jgi:hypothetical protein
VNLPVSNVYIERASDEPKSKYRANSIRKICTNPHEDRPDTHIRPFFERDIHSIVQKVCKLSDYQHESRIKFYAAI